jgi:hypothetical protein
MPRIREKVHAILCRQLIVDAVTSLHNHLAQNLAGPSNSTSLAPLITHLSPLILDSSSSVRLALLDLLADLAPQTVPTEALQAHISMLLLYIQSAMTHIQADIRSDSTKFLSWILDVAALEVVRTAWAKVLSSYAGMLGWSVGSGEKSRIQLARGTSVVGNLTVTARHINTLYSLLTHGLSEAPTDTKQTRPKIFNYLSTKSGSLQHPLIQSYLLPTHSAPYAYLNLFGAGLGDNQSSSHDVPSRRAQFEQYVGPLLQYLHDLSAELVPTDLSRQPNQTTLDDLRVSIIKLLVLVKDVYLTKEETRQSWQKEWKRCLKKVSNIVEARIRSEGSRRIVREWELGNFAEV